MIDCKECMNCNICGIRSMVEGKLTSCKSFTQKKPQTNADRIRALSDEELADLISDPVTYSFNCGMCPADPQFGSCVHKCKPHILAWLKSEVKE